MITFKLTTPVNVGTLTTPISVSSLAVTGVTFSTTPALAQVGTAELAVTLTDTVSGWQETVRYLDASVVTFFSQPAPTPPAGATMQDVMAAAIFGKLLADGALGAGSFAYGGTTIYSTALALAVSPSSAAPGASVTLTATLSAPSGTPDGTVTFYDGTTVIGTAAPASGVATLEVTSLTSGAHSITATLASTSGFAGSASKAVTVTIS